jgi:alkanesulfonate monooxygenase SsuD/methylene tetrahydromethanopterin reductase-like flavin-dependent oxidoreductase (luciferase family)
MSSSPAQSLHLALEVDGDGAHPAAWRQTDRPPEAVATVHSVRATVAAAQDAGFALATFADGPLALGRLEAGTRAAYLSTVTDRIGLAPTLHAPVTEPFHLATQLAALDHASHGRAGWIVGAANGAAERATIGAEPLAPDELRRELLDVVAVARALWDSWEDDAVIKDLATGHYLDSDKVHHVDFTGASFTVKGPLITPRPPQGQIVVFAEDALDIDASADVVLIGRDDVPAIGERARQAKAAGVPLTFAEVEFVLDGAEPAAERLAELDGTAPWLASPALRYVGPVAGFVDLLRALAGAVDGVRLHPAALSVDLPIFIEQALPALSSEGLLRPAPRPGETLRAALGLPHPANRFADVIEGAAA